MRWRPSHAGPAPGDDRPSGPGFPKRESRDSSRARPGLSRARRHKARSNGRLRPRGRAAKRLIPGLAEAAGPARRPIAPGLKLVAIAIASIALMMIDHADGRLSSVRSTLAVVFAPARISAELPGEAIDYLDRYFDRSGLIRSNHRLSQQVLKLRSKVQKLAAIQAQNARIRALLSSARSIDHHVLIARVLSVGPDPYQQSVKLDKGSSQGVFVGQTLVDGHGVMGQVTGVTSSAARAMLISATDSAIPVEINRTGLHTVAQGTGRSGRLKLPFLPDNADIKVGDLLVSSGLGGRYTPNYPVARISRVERRAGQDFLDVTAQPTAALNRGREALLVWNTRSKAGHRASPHRQTHLASTP